jgi:hypothetical protein
MPWTLVIAGALLPAPLARDIVAALPDDRLVRCLAHAQVMAEMSATPIGAPHLGWIWQGFGGQGDLVSAPFLWTGEQPAQAAQVWQLDAVHYRFARDHLLVTPLDDAPPSDDELAALEPDLSRALAELAADALPQLQRTAQGWLLALARPWRLAASPLAAAIGQSAQLHWADGDDGPLWRRLLTEVQTAWHAHPINQRRESEGRNAINGLWLHGGGGFDALAGRGIRRWAALADDDPLLRGWAHASDVSFDAQRSAGDALVLSLWPQLHAAARAQAWGVWLAAATPIARRLEQWIGEAPPNTALHLVLTGEHLVRELRLRRPSPFDLQRLWRKPAPLHELLSEPAP